MSSTGEASSINQPSDDSVQECSGSVDQGPSHGLDVNSNAVSTVRILAGNVHEESTVGNRHSGGIEQVLPEVVFKDSIPDSPGEKDGGLEVRILVTSRRERYVVPGEPDQPTAPSRDTAWQVSNDSTIQAVPIHEGTHGHHGYTGASSNSDNRDEAVSPSVRDKSAILVGGEAVPDRAGCGGFLPNSIANGSGSQMAADGMEADRGPYVKEINKGGVQDGSLRVEDGDVHENQPGTNYTERNVEEDRDDVDDKIESDEIAPSTTDDTPGRRMSKKRKKMMQSGDISGIGEIQPEIRKKEKCHVPEVKKSKFNDAVSVRAKKNLEMAVRFRLEGKLLVTFLQIPTMGVKQFPQAQKRDPEMAVRFRLAGKAFMPVLKLDNYLATRSLQIPTMGVKQFPQVPKRKPEKAVRFRLVGKLFVLWRKMGTFFMTVLQAAVKRQRMARKPIMGNMFRRKSREGIRMAPSVRKMAVFRKIELMTMARSRMMKLLLVSPIIHRRVRRGSGRSLESSLPRSRNCYLTLERKKVPRN